jgi:hypothetical protein
MHRNIIKPGMIASTTIDPLRVLEDVDKVIRRLEPDSTPLVTLSQHALRGAKPTSFKITQIEYDAFDHFDTISDIIYGSATGSAYTRFALIKPDQLSRPFTQDVMFYSPQDTLFIQKTGQNVQVVMTPTQAIWLGDDATSVLTLPAGLTGGTTTTTQAGYILVRSVKDEPIATLPANKRSDIIFLGRTIKESQDIMATPHHRDVLYNCNFVEHMEAMIKMTDDQKTWVKTKGTVPEFTWQQQELMWEFKRSVEQKLMWGARQVDFSDPVRPTRYMEGLYNAIKTNVATYNPSAITDFEQFINNFLYDIAFKTNPNGYKKIGIAGPRVLQRFNMAFKDYRRTDSMAPTGKVGLNFDTYVLPGGFELKFLRTDLLRMGTGLEDWLFVIDPKEIEIRLVKDFATRLWQKEGGRDWNLMVEWQGSVAWHREQAHSLLKTA